MKKILGCELSPQNQQKVLSRYIGRYTGDHKPSWVTNESLQFIDDNDWLCNTTFTVRNDDSLDKRFHHCESSPTWPNNPELHKGVTS